MLGSSQRPGGEIHHHYYHHLALNNHFPPLFFGHQHQLHNQVLGFDKGAACALDGGGSSSDHLALALLGGPYGGGAGVAAEPTSVLDLWSPSPSSKGGCSGVSGGNNNRSEGGVSGGRYLGPAHGSPSPPQGSCFDDNRSNTSVKSAEVRRHEEAVQETNSIGFKGGGGKDGFGWSVGRSRDRSLDEWLADLQQQKLVQGEDHDQEEEEVEVEFDHQSGFFPSAPASSSNNNNNNNNSGCSSSGSRAFILTGSAQESQLSLTHSHKQFAIEELESMLLSPSSSSAPPPPAPPPPPPPPPPISHHLGVAKWLMSEQEAPELHHSGFQPMLNLKQEGFVTGFGKEEMFFSSLVQAPGKPPPPPLPPPPTYVQQQHQAPVYHHHQPVGLEHFLQAVPPFEEAFQHDHQLEAMLSQPMSQPMISRGLSNGGGTAGGSYGGLVDAVGWSTEQQHQQPEQQQQPQRKRRSDPFADARAEHESKNRMMMMQLMQQSQQCVLNPFLTSAFAVPLVADVKPPQVVIPPPRKLQRVHSSSDRKPLLPPPLPSPLPPGGGGGGVTSGGTTGSTTTLPSTISVPDEGGLGLMDQLLQLAQAIDVGSNQLAQSILARLNQHLFCHQGKRIQRLAFYFKEALASRMNSSVSPPPSSSSCPASSTITSSATTTSTTTTTTKTPGTGSTTGPLDLFNKVRAYTSFCEISPLLRFCYLSANQSILESIQGDSSVHIVDFDPRFGSQWASLLQDLVSRTSRVPELRFTMVGPDVTRLTFVVESLREFATSVQLTPPPRFNIIVCDNPARLSPSSLGIAEGESLIYNFMFSLHRALAVPDGADAAVNAVMGTSPRLVTVAEQEVDDNEGKFQRRFVETLQYYAFVLDSLGPEDGAGMLTVEREILSGEIGNAVSEEGLGRTERHERLSTWKGRMTRAGFDGVGMSEMARMQGECLIKRHSHGKNFEVVREEEGGMFLGWQGKNLVSVSAWTPADSSSAGDNNNNKNGSSFKMMNNNNNNIC